MIPTNSQDPKESISAFKILEDHAKAGAHQNPAILKKNATNHSTTALKKESFGNVSMETGYSDESNNQGSFNFENWNQLIDMDITVPHPPRPDHEANIGEFTANFPRENLLSVSTSNDPANVASFKQEQNLATPDTNFLHQNYRNNTSNFSHKAAYDMSYAQENSQLAHGSNNNRSINNVTSDSENNNLLEILNLPVPQTEEEAYLLEEYFKYKQQWYTENNNTASAPVSNAPVEMMAEESLNDERTSAEEANAIVLQNTLNIVPNGHVHTENPYNFRNLRDHNNPLIQAQLAAQGTNKDSHFLNSGTTITQNYPSGATSSNNNNSSSNSSNNIAHNYNSSGASSNNNSSNNSIVGNIPLEFLYDLPPNIPPIPKKVNQNFTNLPSTDNRTVPTLSAELAAQVLAATQSPKELNHQKDIKTNKLNSAIPTAHDNITQQQLLKKNTYSNSGNNSNNSSNNSSSNSIGVQLPYADTRILKGYTPPVVDNHTKLPNPGNANNTHIKPPLPLPSHVMHNNFHKINNIHSNTVTGGGGASAGGMSVTGSLHKNHSFSDNMFNNGHYGSPVSTPPHPALPKHLLASQLKNSTNNTNSTIINNTTSGSYSAHNNLTTNNTQNYINAHNSNHNNMNNNSNSRTNNNFNHNSNRMYDVHGSQHASNMNHNHVNISKINNSTNNNAAIYGNSSINNNSNSSITTPTYVGPNGTPSHFVTGNSINSTNSDTANNHGYYNNNRNLHTNSGSGNNSSNNSISDVYNTGDRHNYNNSNNNNSNNNYNSNNFTANSKSSANMYSGLGDLIPAQQTNFVYLVDFKKRRLDFFLSAECTDKLEVGDVVIVTADRGDDLGVLVEIVSFRDYMIRNKNKTNVNGVVLRLAYPNEINSIGQKLKDEDQVTEFARNLAHNIYHLNIQILDSEYQFDRHKLTIYYDAAGRTDFRDFVKAMYITFKARIWMERLPAERGYFGR